MFFTSLLAGGATGILGSIFSNLTDLWKDHEARKQDLALRQLDLEMIDKEWSYKNHAIEIEGETKLSESADDLRSASYGADRAVYSLGAKITNPWMKAGLVLVDVIRGLVRPFLTIYLVWLVWETRAEMDGIISAAGGSAISGDAAIQIYQSVVSMILYLAATAVTWWFGTRPVQKTK